MKAKFIKAVDSKDTLIVRFFLANEMMLDPRGRSFQEMLDYAVTNLDDLYETSDGKVYNQTEAEWDREFLFQLKNDLEYNFSQERVDFYVKVAKHVLKEKAIQLDKEESQAKSGNNSNYTRRTSGSKASAPKKKAYAGITAGGAILAIAGLCAEKAALASLGVAGVVIGGVLLYKEAQK